MKPPLTAALHGTGLLLAFAAGWWLKPAASPGPEASLHPVLPVKPIADPPFQKTPKASAASGAKWLDAAAADVAAVRLAMQPGMVNQVLLDKLEAVLRLHDESVRLTRWRALMETMRKEDAPAVLALWRKEFTGGRKTEGVEDLFWHQWGRLNGSHAVDLAWKDYGETAATNVLAGWACVQPEAALAWMTQNGGKVGRPAAIKTMVSAMAADSPASAIQFIRAHVEEPDFKESLGLEMDFAVRERGLAVAASSFEEIARSSLPDNYKKANLYNLAGHFQQASHWSEPPGNPNSNESTAILLKYLGEGWFSPILADDLARRIAASNPESGVAQLNRFTNEKGRETFAYNLFDDWSIKDPLSLSQWLTRNRDHAEFDRATFRLVLSTSQSDPEAAKAWAAQIQNPEYLQNIPEVLKPPTPPSGPAPE